MTVPRADAEVVAALEDLAAHLDWPEEVDLAPAVRARLAPAAPPLPPSTRPGTGAVVGQGRRWGWTWGTTTGRRWVPALAAIVALALVASAVLAGSPSARRAVADWLGLRGVEIKLDGGTTTTRPAPPEPPEGTTLQLGRAVTLAEARSRAGFPLLVPEDDDLGGPDGVFIDESVAGGAVSLVYRSRPGFPSAGPGDVGLLLTQFRAAVDQASLRKVVPGQGRVEEVAVNGQKGYWFEGSPHRLFFADDQGRFVEDRSRLAGNTLIWEQGDLTVRLESALSRDEAVRRAEELG